jgi:DNA-binding CsgD family transcriptional regulator
MATLVAHGYIWNERYAEARRFLEAQVTTLRQASAPMMLPYLLAAQGELDLRTGRWQDARAAFTEAVDLGETTGLRSPYAGAYLARLEAFRGREEAARRNAGPAVAFGEQLGLESLVSYGRHALGLVELGADRPEHAIHELEQLAALLDRHGIENPGVVQWAPDLIEAYARCGRGKEAEAHLARLERQGRRTGNTWAQAAAHRCRGLLASEPDYRAEFERALQLHELTATPFERARTELCYGERLRRGRHRREARGWLASAAETFDALGALPWASRARAELRSSGQTLRRREAWDQDQLTARELQIAVLVAGGASNRDAAAALFLSPRTIDAHLGSIYRKLDVHSRQELASALTG